MTERERIKSKKAFKIPVISKLSELLLLYFPDLKKKLILAEIRDSAQEFIEKVILSSISLALAITILFSFVFYIINLKIEILLSILVFFVLLPLLFIYFLFYPDAKILAREKEIDRELVFAGRHIVIGLKAGMPLYDVLVGASSDYGAVSKEIRKIIEKVNAGIPMTQAIREAANLSPSRNLSRILIQIANSLSSGADVADSLNAVLNQIAKEQTIALKEYGQKLNPLVMFFLMFGIIFPSLGVAFVIILFSIINFSTITLNPVVLFSLFVITSIVQFMFVNIIEKSRPNYMV